jgi:hypothetical protein
MTGDELWAEGMAIARPVVRLASIFAEEEPRRHVFLAAGGGFAWLDDGT